jgi:hypothetical protein
MDDTTRKAPGWISAYEAALEGLGAGGHDSGRLPKEAVLATGLGFQGAARDALDLDLANVGRVLAPPGDGGLLDPQLAGHSRLCLEVGDDLSSSHTVIL